MKTDSETIYHQAVRVWKALVGIVGEQGQALLFVAWTKARLNPLTWGASIQPAFSVRFQAEYLTAWWPHPQKQTTMQ
jgi:hypothetical protein